MVRRVALSSCCCSFWFDEITPSTKLGHLTTSRWSNLSATPPRADDHVINRAMGTAGSSLLQRPTPAPPTWPTTELTLHRMAPNSSLQRWAPWVRSWEGLLTTRSATPAWRERTWRDDDLAAPPAADRAKARGSNSFNAHVRRAQRHGEVRGAVQRRRCVCRPRH